MKTDWRGHYLDGRTAVRQRAAIRLMRSGLEITIESVRPLDLFPETYHIESVTLLERRATL